MKYTATLAKGGKDYSECTDIIKHKLTWREVVSVKIPGYYSDGGACI